MKTNGERSWVRNGREVGEGGGGEGGGRDSRLTVPARWPSPSSNECLNLVSVPNDAEGITKHVLNYVWAIMSQNNNVQVI